jgi:hypothetical protein
MREQRNLKGSRHKPCLLGRHNSPRLRWDGSSSSPKGRGSPHPVQPAANTIWSVRKYFKNRDVLTNTFWQDHQHGCWKLERLDDFVFPGRRYIGKVCQPGTTGVVMGVVGRRCSWCAFAGVGGSVKVRPICKLNDSNLDVGVLYNIYNTHTRTHTHTCIYISA